MTAADTSSDSLLAFVKASCPTCRLAAPALDELARRGQLVVFVQDDPGAFQAGRDDRSLEQSFRHHIEIVPTLIRRQGDREIDRAHGWDRAAWQRVSRCLDLGAELPAFQPGCGSPSREPNVHEHLVARFGDSAIASRRVEIGAWDDEHEACFERGWTDGLPVVPPPTRASYACSRAQSCRPIT